MARRTNITKLEILQVAIRQFLQNGFTNTSAKAISRELGISTGNLTFYFPTKEHLLLEFAKEITGFHTNCIDDVVKKSGDDLFSYCWEVTAQIALCESNEQMKDIYLALYSHQTTLDYIRDWTAEKNYKLFAERLPDWTLERFRRAEIVSCCIERSALTEECDEKFTMEEKIRLILTCLLKIYDIPKDERDAVIEKILETDYKKIGAKLQKQLTKYVETLNQQAIEDAIKERKNI